MPTTHPLGPSMMADFTVPMCGVRPSQNARVPDAWNNCADSRLQVKRADAGLGCHGGSDLLFPGMSSGSAFDDLELLDMDTFMDFDKGFDIESEFPAGGDAPRGGSNWGNPAPVPALRQPHSSRSLCYSAADVLQNPAAVYRHASLACQKSNEAHRHPHQQPHPQPQQQQQRLQGNNPVTGSPSASCGSTDGFTVPDFHKQAMPGGSFRAVPYTAAAEEAHGASSALAAHHPPSSPAGSQQSAGCAAPMIPVGPDGEQGGTGISRGLL